MARAECICGSNENWWIMGSNQIMGNPIIWLNVTVGNIEGVKQCSATVGLLFY